MTTSELKALYSKDEDTGCWLWHGPTKVRYALDKGQHSSMHYPHRLLWALVHKQAIPHGMALVRQCSTELCVAPSHHILTSKQSPIAQYEYTAPTA